MWSFALKLLYQSSLLAALLALSSASQAAEIRIRNNSAKDIIVAVAYNWIRGIDWNSTHKTQLDGYWRVKPGETATLFKEEGGKVNSVWIKIRPEGSSDWNETGRASYVVSSRNLTFSNNRGYMLRRAQDSATNGNNEELFFRDLNGYFDVKSQSIVNKLQAGQSLTLVKVRMNGCENACTFTYP
jgi:hypothetical protein